MAKKKRTSGSRWADQAARESLVRFGPQLDVLKEAQRTAQGNYESAVAQADAGKVGVQQAVDAVAPDVKAIYDKAGLGQVGTTSLVNKDLAGLGPIADSIKAGSSLEAKNMADSLGAAQAQAVTGLANRRVQATSGAVAAKRQAHSQLVDDLTKILQSSQDITGQKGTFAASVVDQLRTDQEKRDFDAAQNAADRTNRTDIAAGHDKTSRRNTDVRTAAQQRKANKTRWATPQQHGDLKDKVSTALTYVKQALAQGESRHHIADELLQGVSPATYSKDPSTGKPLNAPVHVPGIPKTPELVASIALDLGYDGHVSAANIRELHKRKYKVKALGYPTPPRGLAREGQKAIQSVAAILP